MDLEMQFKFLQAIQSLTDTIHLQTKEMVRQTIVFNEIKTELEIMNRVGLNTFTRIKEG